MAKTTRIPGAGRDGSRPDEQPTDGAADASGGSALEVRIFTHGVALSPDVEAHVRERLDHQIGRFAHHVEHVVARFEDLNGPKGGIDIECRVQVTISSRPTVVVSSRAGDAHRAFDAVVTRLGRVLRRELDRAGFSANGRGRDRRRTKGTPPPEESAPNESPAAGSLYGRRVGRGPQNLTDALARPEKSRRDALVDTARPGVSESDRRAGGGSTARRNTKAKNTRHVADLEDSATGKPSRMSTRKSSIGLRSGLGLAGRTVARTHSPESHAAAAAARGSKATSKGGDRNSPDRGAVANSNEAGRGGKVRARRGGIR